jgi:hypothetical protein
MDDYILKTLFLNPPSFDGFDDGAGARYQTRREVRSFWYPIWLAQPAALVPGSRLLDAPARGVSLDPVIALARDYERRSHLQSGRPSGASEAAGAVTHSDGWGISWRTDRGMVTFKKWRQARERGLR